MEGNVIAGIVSSIVTAVSLYLIAKVNTKAGNESATVASALSLQKRYEDMNTNLEKQMREMKTDFNKKINVLETQMEEMSRKFVEKENYYKSELEKKDDRIEELEIENTGLKSENMVLKGEKQ